MIEISSAILQQILCDAVPARRIIYTPRHSSRKVVHEANHINDECIARASIRHSSAFQRYAPSPPLSSPPPTPSLHPSTPKIRFIHGSGVSKRLRHRIRRGNKGYDLNPVSGRNRPPLLPSNPPPPPPIITTGRYHHHHNHHPLRMAEASRG